MPKRKFPFYGVIVHLGLNHSVQTEWDAARDGAWFPEPMPIGDKPGPKKGVHVVYSSAMMLWLISLQVNETAAAFLLRIGAVLLNRHGNSAYIKHKHPLQNFIPIRGTSVVAGQRVWNPKPAAQKISCGGSTLKILGESKDGKCWEIEMLKPFDKWEKRPKFRPGSHPWFFARLAEVQIRTGAIRIGGLVWPLFSKTGRGFIAKNQVTVLP